MAFLFEVREDLALKVSMDRAYHNQLNALYAKKHYKQFHYSSLQRTPGRFIYELTEKGVEVKDRSTGAIQFAQEYKPRKYKTTRDGKLRYFKE